MMIILILKKAQKTAFVYMYIYKINLNILSIVKIEKKIIVAINKYGADSVLMLVVVALLLARSSLNSLATR